jgi:ABC-type amino acid transport substrate-binding protein
MKLRHSYDVRVAKSNDGERSYCMKKIVVIASAVVIVALIITFSSFFKKEAEQQENLLVVGTNPNFPPFEYKEDGELVGFDIDLMHAIGDYLGKKIVFKEMPFDALLIEAETGRINLIASGMTPTAERSKKLFFTEPYVGDDPLVVITLASAKPQTLKDLHGKEVIVNDGYTAESYMKQQSGINLIGLATPAESFLAILNGRAYAYVSARSAVQPFFDRYGEGKFNILTLDVSDRYALAVPKAYPEVFEEIKGALDALTKNGILRQLKQQWHLDF